jgi:hypothetical protein
MPLTKESKPKQIVITKRNSAIVSVLSSLFVKFPTRAPSSEDSREMNDYTDLVNCLPLGVIKAAVKYFLDAAGDSVNYPYGGVYGKVCPNPTRFIHRAVRFVIEPAVWAWFEHWDGETTVPVFVAELVNNIRSLNQSYGNNLAAKIAYLRTAKDGKELVSAFTHYTCSRRAIEGRRYPEVLEFV